MQTWKTRSRHIILDKGKFLKVEEHEVELPDGTVIPDWTWVDTPDFINVALVTVDHQFVLFKQTKYAIDGVSLAPVGGYLEPGEDPLAAAKRETMEETGYEAPDWTSLGTYAVDGNRGSGTAHLFLATGAQRVAEPDADDLEDQEMVLLTFAEVKAAVKAGEFKVLPWQVVMALGVIHLER